MNLYEILELDETNTITNNDIKLAFKRMVLKYHPDKSSDPDATEKFIQIKYAYDILSNKEKREEYDRTKTIDENDLYNMIEKFISMKLPNVSKYFNFVKENINKKLKSDTNHKKVLMLDITGDVVCSLQDRYLDRYAVLNVNRKTRPPAEFAIPLKNNLYVIKNEGETDGKLFGDLVISINVVNDTSYTYLKTDLYKRIDISLYDYLYGGEITYEQLDGEIQKIKHNGFLKKDNIIIIHNKGLPNDEDATITERGDLIIDIYIKDIDNEQFKHELCNFLFNSSAFVAKE